MLTAQSREHPSFHLHMGTAVRDLIRSGDRVVVVKTDGSDGPREFAADRVIGTDGRYSMGRKLGDFIELRSPQHFDVLNFMVPFPDFWPDHTTVRLELGPGCLTGGIPTVAIQEHQRRQTQTFLRSDRLSSRLAMGLLPLLAKSGLAHLLIGKRLRALNYGVVPVRLTA
jgi:2-polyprenyl-6-methoxyphenol hydroxylase-like FAD-dependent oxidoreductase